MLKKTLAPAASRDDEGAASDEAGSEVTEKGLCWDGEGVFVLNDSGSVFSTEMDTTSNVDSVSTRIFENDWEFMILEGF